MPNEIDHIDGNRSNNRLENLRSVTRAENNRNQRLSSLNTTGDIGVYLSRRKHTPWEAKIKTNGISIHLGTFATKDEAIAARCAAEKVVGFHQNHGRD